MFNQKGIVLSPALVWTVIIVGSILLAQDAVKRGYITIDLNHTQSSVQEANEIPGTPLPSPPVLPTQTPEPTFIPTPKPTIAQTPTPILKPTISGSEVFNLVNAYRRSQSLSGLDVSDELCKFAQTRANFLVADNEKAARESSTENHIGFRDQVSFDQYSGDYVGENIARIGINSTSYSSSGVVTGWKNSPPHNKLLLRTEENRIISNKGCVATATNQEATVTVLLVGDK